MPRAARRDRGWRRDETISCLHEKRCVAAGTVDDAEWLSHAVGCVFRWGRLPIGEIDHIWACAPPCGIVWLPDGVGQWQGGVGGFFVCVGSLFRSLVYEYVHYLFQNLGVSLELVRNTRRRRPCVCQEWYESRISF